jgi:hypothetical protein
VQGWVILILGSRGVVVHEMSPSFRGMFPRRVAAAAARIPGASCGPAVSPAPCSLGQGLALADRGYPSSVRLLAAALIAAALAASAATASTPPAVQPLPAWLKTQLRHGFWQANCPVPIGRLRLITVRTWGFDGQPRTGQLVVNAAVAEPLVRVFAKLYALRFPIRKMELTDAYVPGGPIPDGDVTASFECRQASASPCTGKVTTGTWSNHAYGLAVDVNPSENPYIGCGMTRDPKVLTYTNRSRLRKGMVTPAVVRAFASIGWGWGGSWTGSTKDYMHFSYNGH